MKLIPVLELKDFVYASKYVYLPVLFDVTDTVLLHPEDEISNSYRRRQKIKEYLKSRYNVDLNAKIMFDHGIFISNEKFRQMFSTEKTAESILKVYNVLGVDYGIAFDIPSRLHLQYSIEIAVARALHRDENRLIRSINEKVRGEVEAVASILSGFLTKSDEKTMRDRLQRMLREKHARLYRSLRLLSMQTVEESLKNLKEQLEIKSKRGYKFQLIPVVQGLFEDHAKMALREILDLLGSYGEFVVENNSQYFYIAIGTSGTQLSESDEKMINSILVYGHELAKKEGINIRFHLLGINSFDKIRADLVYSADAVTVRRRAVDGKLYVIEDGKLKLIEVDKIKEWDCNCPACNRFKELVLEKSSRRRNDVRMIHNLFVLSQFVNQKQERSQSLKKAPLLQ